MLRTRIAVLLAVVLVGLLALPVSSVLGGCHGGCWSPGPGPSSNPCNHQVDGSVAPAMDVATTGSDPSTNIEFYSFPVGTGPLFYSWIFPGEATVFYVTSGTITFTLDSNIADGTARVVSQSSTAPGAAGEFPEIDAGGALFIDAQDQRVQVSYENTGSAGANLVVTSAIPCSPASASPTPGIPPGSGEEVPENALTQVAG